LAQFPATSQTLSDPVEAFAVSVPAGTAVAKAKLAAAANPDPSSLAVQGMLASLACHLPSGEPHAIFGGIVSRFTVMELEAVPPALVAVQVNVTPVVSELTAAEPQPDDDWIGDSPSTTFQATATLLTYQPLLPAVPVMIGVMMGGVLSTGERSVTMRLLSTVKTNCCRVPLDAMPAMSCSSVVSVSPAVAMVSL
jgi:hypothetical protein